MLSDDNLIDEFRLSCEPFFLFIKNEVIKIYIDYKSLMTLNYMWFLLVGGRGIGKTYGALKFIINYCIKKKLEFVYIVRTKSVKDNGALGSALAKVLSEQFTNYTFESTNNELFILENKKGKEVKRRIAVCYALTEVHKIKYTSAPKVKFIFFDEFILEKKKGLHNRYISNFNEPDLLLNLYHTLDRERDFIKVIMCANALTSVNPYFIHKFFSVPHLKVGDTFKNRSVIAMNLKASDELIESRKSNKFIQQMGNIDYSMYLSGEYLEDNELFISNVPNETNDVMFNIVISGEYYECIYGYKSRMVYIQNTKNVTFTSYALDEESHTERTVLATKKDSGIKVLKEYIVASKIRYNTLETKKIVEKELYKLL